MSASACKLLAKSDANQKPKLVAFKVKIVALVVAAVRDGFYLVKVYVALSEVFTIALIPRGASQPIKSFSKSNFANVKMQGEVVDVF